MKEKAFGDPSSLHYKKSIVTPFNFFFFEPLTFNDILKPNKRYWDPTSYIPISLLPLFSKVFERLLLPKFLHYLESLLPNTQFGFRKSHSCPQQLHRVVDEILKAYKSKQICLGLFLDTEKAFDKVWLPGLLYKVKPHLPETYYRLL
jgi:hypothetical protein